MHQQIVIVDDANERTILIAQALRESGYGVTTLYSRDNKELYKKLCRLKADFLLIGDDVVIDLKSDYGRHVLNEMAISGQ